MMEQVDTKDIVEIYANGRSSFSTTEFIQWVQSAQEIKLSVAGANQLLTQDGFIRVTTGDDSQEAGWRVPEAEAQE
ncbi:hypothetical protein [Photobacterium atrarenae]|uniref:Uncharacterized protein n=1 Tax=Photobacterium atrarenae TaxID=865757 RepID=A0ABY5GLH7_9GAMM|nr:hypothetical protein [Photobacterium atrarenae]UTV30172.1 hypothetical protein NNL38_16430 [Photobacterium atrarenae]